MWIVITSGAAISGSEKKKKNPDIVNKYDDICSDLTFRLSSEVSNTTHVTGPFALPG